MNLKYTLLLLFNTSIFCAAFWNSVNGQTFEIKTSFYDEVSAMRSSKKTTDYNLTGRIKSLAEISPINKDTTFYDFNEKGFLQQLKYTGSRKTGKTKWTTTYTFENNQLKKIRTENPFNKSTLEKYYGPSGYLEKHVRDFIDYEEKFHEEAVYSYSISHKDLKITYHHKNQSDSWDLALSDEYTFVFDSRLMLVKVRNKSKHSESTYGQTSQFTYDTLSGKLIHASYLDDCAGSNSCLDLSVSINYDDRGNIIYESFEDHTIRNAGWSYGYIYFARYNEKDDIIEEYRSSNENRIASFGLQSKLPAKPKDYDKLKKTFEYEYDLKGNWIKKYSISTKTRNLIVERTINYY